MKPGTVFSERYAIERAAGSGGMGDVYRARDRDGRAVAVKVLRDEAALDDRFVKEVRAIQGMNHAAIVRYLDHGITTEGERYLVTEWLEGEDLGKRLERGPLGVAEAVALTVRVAEALAIAHARGIVHRDIKPGNLFLVGGECAEVKLLDFGIARLRSASLLVTATGAVIGTPGYMAPEQARGDKELDARADVFALGAVLFECLTGRYAFTGEHVMAVLAKVLLEDPPPVRELREEVSVELERLVARMLAKAPDQRPADGGTLALELRALDVAGEAAVAPAETLTGGEQRLLCVVLAAPPPGQDSPETLELVRAAVEVFGAAAERLADGSVLVTLAGTGAATDQVAQAARCALAMRSLLPGCRLALATGHAVTRGRIAAGEAIDRAARLLAVDPEAEPVPVVRMDDASASLLDARFEVGADARGVCLVGEKEVADAARQLLGRPSPTVGRDREMATLNALFDECVEDQVARAALVTAPAGTGKSRIRHEFLNGVRRREKPVVIWLGRGDPMSAGSPFGMIVPAIRRAASILDGEPLAIRQAKLRARLARHLAGSELVRVTAFLGELIGAPFADEHNLELRTARQDARLMGDQMMRAWQDWLAAESAAQPVVIVLEDLHWGDPPTVSFTDAALRYLKDRPLMVLALARPEVHEIFPRLWAERGAQEIRLGELTRRASEKLVREVLGDSVTAETVERVVTLAAGNAFYLEELIRAVAEGKAEALPETVLAMVEARLQGLELEARRILRAASVFGGSFWRGGVAGLLGSSEGAAALDHWLAELAEREFVTRRATSRFPGETEYQFRHDLVRAAAYDMLTEGDRALGHRLVAEWLERMGETDAMALAQHFEKGGEPSRAIPWYLRAAQQALEGNDLPSAIERAERGVMCGAEGEVRGALRLVQVEACCWQGQYAIAKGHGWEAMEHLPYATPAWASAANYAQWAAATVGDDEGLERVADALRALDQQYVTNAAICTMGKLATTYAFRGNLPAAEHLLGRAEAVARPLVKADPGVEADLIIGRAMSVIAAGGFGSTIGGELAVYTMLGRGIELLLRIGNLRQAALTSGNLGWHLVQMGAFDEAEIELSRAMGVAQRFGLRHVEAVALQNLALTLHYLGRFDEARRPAQRALEEFASFGDWRRVEATRAYLALIELRSGRLAEAEHEARAAVALEATSPGIRVLSLAILGQVLLACHRPREALDGTVEAIALRTQGVAMEENENLLLLTHAEALAVNGRREEAHDAIRTARDSLRSRAAMIPRADWQRSFLERMPENARTLQLAREWLGDE